MRNRTPPDPHDPENLSSSPSSEGLPLWHHADPDTSVDAAAAHANKAIDIRDRLMDHLKLQQSEGLTADEANQWVEQEFPEVCDNIGRRRLSDLMNKGAVRTRRRRPNRRGNMEAVVVHQDYHYVGDPADIRPPRASAGRSALDSKHVGTYPHPESDDGAGITEDRQRQG